MKHSITYLRPISLIFLLATVSFEVHSMNLNAQLTRHKLGKQLSNFKSALRRGKLEEAAGLAAAVAKKTYHASVVANDKILIFVAAENNADINECLNGKTPLALAASLGRLSLLTELLMQKPDARATCVLSDDFKVLDGMTALHWAASANQPGSVDVLLKNCGLAAQIIDLPNKQGMTPLMLAAQGGFVEVARRLLGARAETEQQSQLGNSALALAAHSGHEEMIKLLLDHGARLNVVNNAGMTAFDLAGRAGHDELLPLLKTANSRRQTYASPKASPKIRPASPPFLCLDDHEEREEDEDAQDSPHSLDAAEEEKYVDSLPKTPSSGVGRRLQEAIWCGNSDGGGSETPTTCGAAQVFNWPSRKR